LATAFPSSTRILRQLEKNTAVDEEKNESGDNSDVKKSPFAADNEAYMGDSTVELTSFSKNKVWPM